MIFLKALQRAYLAVLGPVFSTEISRVSPVKRATRATLTPIRSWKDRSSNPSGKPRERGYGNPVTTDDERIRRKTLTHTQNRRAGRGDF
jgi:hypothetical protein